MNKSLTVSFVFSLGLHLSTITLAKEGMILQDYIYNPKELFMKAMQNRQQMNLLFVDTVQQDLGGAKPVATGVISDNDSVAQDKSLQHAIGNLAPNLGKVSGAKQLGDTSPAIGPTVPGSPGQNVQMMDDIKVAPQMPASQAQGYYPKKGQPAAPKPKTFHPEEPAPKTMEPAKQASEAKLADQQQKAPDQIVEKQEPYLDVTTKRADTDDVIIPGQQPGKDDSNAVRNVDVKQPPAQKEDYRKKRQELEDWLADQEQDQQEDRDEAPRGSSDEGREDVPGKKAQNRRGAVALQGGSFKKLSSDESGDVERFGAVSFNAQKYALGHYFKKIKDKVEGYWLPYLAFTYSGDSFKENRTVVLFRIYPSGEVKYVKVLEHRGDEVLRDFCVAAIKNTAPYDPLPETFLSMVDYGYLPIVFTFMY